MNVAGNMAGVESAWTVTVAAERGVPVSEDAVELIHDALITDPAARGLSVRYDVVTPEVAARFEVEAASADAAAEIAVAAFARALESAGVRARLEVADVVPTHGAARC